MQKAYKKAGLSSCFSRDNALAAELDITLVMGFDYAKINYGSQNPFS